MTLFFLRRIIQVRMSEEQNRLVVVLNRNKLNCVSLIVEKDAGATRKGVSSEQDHFDGRSEAVKDVQRTRSG